MAAPKLSTAVTWDTFETAVLTVLRDALARLTGSTRLTRAEEPINLELYWLLKRVHLDHVRAKTKGMLHFLVLFDSCSQPEPDDIARSERLRKRPDFNCAMMNPQAPDHRTSQINYYVECKRLGTADGAWVLNENYSEHGVNRFVHTGWQYAKGCATATMVGYVQDSVPGTILGEVNAGAAARRFPSLTMAATTWAVRGVNALTQPALARGFAPSPFTLGHLWVDLRHCEFEASTQAPPASAALPPTATTTKKLKKTASTRASGMKPRSKPPKE